MNKSKINVLVFGVLSTLLLWQLLCLLTNNQSLPSPLTTIVKAWEIKGPLLLHAGASLLRILAALTIAVAIGLPFGIFMGRNRLVDRFLGPLIYFLYPLPKVAFLPVFMIFFGLGNLSKILLIFAIVSIQVIVSVRDSVKNIPAGYNQVMDNYNSSHWQKIRLLILPALLPNLLASLRVSVGISLASLFFAENYNTRYGLGYLILSAWTKMDYPEMFAGILAIGLLGFLIFSGLDAIERRTCRYR
ncbi:ABC transporter permease [Enterococcus sp. HY326]|uniref:ABC transporter permease n=1 Tax=Enterococcus sp. HY326 TaxID=2971265 RepID=UPI00223FF3AD|nr:ABC transporter permease [Enterococcus sp. HY326]